MQQSNFLYTTYSVNVYFARRRADAVDLRKIQYFFAVIEHGNLSSAAQSLRLSQPTLSRQIQSIEDQFQTPLFVRGGRGMMLTEAGKQLHEGLQSIERQLRTLKTDVAAVALEPSGEVAFGIPPSPRGLIAVPLVKSFNAAYPRIVVRIVEETSAQLRDLVANGLIDIAVTNTHEPSHGVAARQLGRERMLLVGPVSAKLSMRRETPVKTLAELPLILTTRPNSLRLTIERGLGVHGLQPNVRFEANTLPLMTDLVTAGLGYTVLPACGVRTLLAQHKITASPVSDLFITWLVARPKTRSLGVAAERFYDMLCELGRKQVHDGIWESAA
jgi:LysR family transcriptional regulator, nitrogen assimilation regulatory protein